MAKPPSRPRKTDRPSAADAGNQVVPTENVAILREGLGVDVAKLSPQKMQALVMAMTQSTSASPYSSAEMLQEYRDRGFPEIADKVILTIDQQIAHRQQLEVFATQQREYRENRAQWGALLIAIAGTGGALFAGYVGVSSYVCGICIVVSVGGPSTATVAARLLDRFGKS